MNHWLDLKDSSDHLVEWSINGGEPMIMATIPDDVRDKKLTIILCPDSSIAFTDNQGNTFKIWMT